MQVNLIFSFWKNTNWTSRLKSWILGIWAENDYQLLNNLLGWDSVQSLSLQCWNFLQLNSFCNQWKIVDKIQIYLYRGILLWFLGLLVYRVLLPVDIVCCLKECIFLLFHWRFKKLYKNLCESTNWQEL